MGTISTTDDWLLFLNLQSIMTEKKSYPQHRYFKPPGATDILLVRHGQSGAATLEDPFDLVDGQGDPELSEEGRRQALRLDERLSNEPIDAIYVTNMRRTAETAAPLARRLKLTPGLEKDLREVHLGEWEGGLFRIKAAEPDPLYLELLRQQDWGVIPGAESGDQLNSRIQVAMKRIVRAHPDQTVMIVSHGGVISQILSQVTASRAFAFNSVDNASISHIVAEGKQLILRRFNDTSHLSSTFTSESTPLRTYP